MWIQMCRILLESREVTKMEKGRKPIGAVLIVPDGGRGESEHASAELSRVSARYR